MNAMCRHSTESRPCFATRALTLRSMSRCVLRPISPLNASSGLAEGLGRGLRSEGLVMLVSWLSFESFTIALRAKVPAVLGSSRLYESSLKGHIASMSPRGSAEPSRCSRRRPERAKKGTRIFPPSPATAERHSMCTSLAAIRSTDLATRSQSGSAPTSNMPAKYCAARVAMVPSPPSWNTRLRRSR